MTANVIDMFHGDDHDIAPDFAKLVVDGITAVIHKLGQGAIIDPLFVDRGQAAGRVGMPFYAYWFSDGGDPVIQARNAGKFMSLVPTCLGWCLDFEGDGINTMAFDPAIAFLNQSDAIQGFRTPIYGSTRLRQRISPQTPYATFFRPRLAWFAEYGPKLDMAPPWVQGSRQLWQFSADNSPGGAGGHIDLNIWPGTASELKEAWRAKL